VVQLRFLRIAVTASVLASMLVVLPGCPLSPDGDDGNTDSRIPPRTSVTGAIEQFAFIWTNKRFPEYEQLLHDNFEYFPQTDDLTDFPWLGEADSWGRTEELGMAQNMFNENFVSQETGNSVDSITMDLDIESQTDSPDGVIVSVHARAQVLWAANSGASSDVRFEFLVVPDPDEPGEFQIKEQRERKLVG
jgi:hypothetical protein